MLTKEECIKALDCLADDDKMDELAQKFSMDDDYTSHVNYEMARKWCYDQLKQCIEEHFSNPPLNIEEIPKNMWIWDNADKEYVHSLGAEEFDGVTYVQFGLSEDSSVTRFCEFESNRFYRKEVQK